MKESARRHYGALYKLGERVDLRPTITPVIERLEAVAAAAQPPRATALARAASLFRGRDGQVARDIKNFDLYGKQYLDDEISKAFRAGDNAIGRELMAFRDELFAALGSATDRNTRRIALLYDRARGRYSDDIRTQGVIERGGTAWDKSTEPAAWLRWYGTLSPEEQKLARYSALRSALRGADERDLARDVTGVFRTPRAEELIPGIISLSRGRRGGEVVEGISGALKDRNLRFGRYVDIEGAMPRTRDVILGGSPTARNAQDDLALAGLETMQQAQGFIEMFRNSTSLFGLGQAIMQKIIDRSFGLSADRAAALSRMLFTANPDERADILRRLIAMMPAARMARFNELMGRVQRGVAPGIVTGGGMAGQPQPPSGPVSL